MRRTASHIIHRSGTPAAHRRGGTYVLVLMTSVMLTITGLSVVALSRAFIVRQAGAGDGLRASDHAVSGIHAALAYINSTPNWRTLFSTANYPGPYDMAPGKVVWWAEDYAGGPVSTDPSRPVKIVSIGEHGRAVKAVSVEAAPPTVPVAIDALRCALHATGNVNLTDTEALHGPVSSDAKLTYSGSVKANLEAIDIQDSGNLTGTEIEVTVSKPIPAGTESLASRGQVMNWAALGGKIEKVVVGPGSSHAGPTSAAGIYVISIPAGQELQITMSRLCATLVVQLGSGSKLTIKEKVFWQPANPSLPTLIAWGHPSATVYFEGTTNDLLESDASTNYNPTQVPYLGVTDADKTDTYPGVLQGVFDIQDGITVDIKNQQRIFGSVLVSGRVTAAAAVLRADPTLLANPPEGYTTTGSTITATAGTWRQISADRLGPP